MGDSTPVGRYHADLHIHSKYSRACSKDADLGNLAWWAQQKGITLLGTGDFTHPAWYMNLRDSLIEAEPGLFRLNQELDRAVAEKLSKTLRSTSGTNGPSNADSPSSATRFMLSVEISTIYKRAGKTRKIHHLVYMPDFEAAAKLHRSLSMIGNLAADGRPILGLDSRDLLEVVLECSPDGYVVPAHIWTPWFGVLGSKSGFDHISDCYADLAEHIFAAETGLSSDPAMNSTVSWMDKYTLVSYSDAHSPPKLGRELTTFSAPLDYFAIRDALRTREGYEGTLEFFPEEGKYHADGHRACGIIFTPAETIAAGGICPVCGKPLTVGVLSRVEALADRPAQPVPQTTHIIALPEILSEIHHVGPKSKKVTSHVDALVAALGPEIPILTTVAIDDITRVGGELLGEAIRRLRAGDVRRESGYDGIFGTIRLFDPDELPASRVAKPPVADTLFDGLFEEVERKEAAGQKEPPPHPNKSDKPGKSETSSASAHRAPVITTKIPAAPFEPVLLGMEEVGTGLLDRLDVMQRVAASASPGAMLIVAGPGTGKTHTLAHRIAYLVAELGVAPEQCLAIAYNRQAASELTAHLGALIGYDAARINVETFHSLGLRILREYHSRLRMPAHFRIAKDDEKSDRRHGVISLDELITLPASLLHSHPEIADRYQARWPWMFVDEYQDVNAAQHQLLTLLSPPDGNLYAIGDPDQAIDSHHGANVDYFLRFTEDFPEARTVRLTRNYRSAAPILAAAVQAIAPSTLVPGRLLEPARREHDSPLIEVYSAADEHEEAEYVVRTIEQLTRGDVTPPEASHAHIAIMYRHEEQAEVLLGAFARAGIPAQQLRVEALTPVAQECGEDLDALEGVLRTAISGGSEVGVTLLSLHAAKGLEFPVVFIVGCEDGMLPNTCPAHSDAAVHLAEERRLFFVGITRAQNRLYVSHAQRRTIAGTVREMSPTPFLSAIESSLLLLRGEAISQHKSPDQQLRLL